MLLQSEDDVHKFYHLVKRVSLKTDIYNCNTSHLKNQCKVFQRYSIVAEFARIRDSPRSLGDFGYS